MYPAGRSAEYRGIVRRMRAIAADRTDAVVCATSVLVTVAASASIPILLAANPQWVLAALFLPMLLLAHRTFGTVILSPLQIVAVGLAALGVAGRLFYSEVAGTPGGAAIRLPMSAGLLDATFTLCLVASVSALFGGLLWAALFGRVGRTPAATLAPPTEVGRGLRRGLLLFAPVPLTLTLAAGNPGRLWERPSYIVEHVASNPLAALGGQLAIAAVLGLGFLWGARSHRFLVLLLALAYVTVTFGGGTRRLALIPLAFAVGYFASRVDLRSKLVLAGAGLLSLYLLQLPLQLRALPTHGIEPYLDYLPAVLADRLPVETTALNVLISFAVIGATAFAVQPIPAGDLWVSLNPLPGTMSGWYDIAPAHRLNEYTPFAGLGELANAGWGVTIACCMVIGAVLAYLDAQVKQLIERGLQMAALAIVGLSGLFLLFFVQYNLRAAGRMLYYAVALDLLAVLWLWRRNRRDVVRAERERVEQLRRDRRLAAVRHRWDRQL